MSIARVTKTIVAGCFNTRYVEAGTHGKPTLVLIHDGGFGTTAENCWAGVIDRLVDDFHIFAPELLGWGGTDKVVYLDRSPYAGRLPHIAAFADGVGIETAFYAGASFGGSLTMRATVAEGNPWRMTKAITISGSGGPYRLQSGIEALAEYTPSIEAATRLTELVVGTTNGLEDHIRDRHEWSLVPGHWESMYAPRLKNPSVERKAPADSYLDQLRALRIPALLVAGARDPLLEAGWARKMTELSSNLNAIELEAGHEPNIDQPERVAELIRDFFIHGKVE
ncbi:alpha/beta fold hydrolase [Oceaniradius stylonematis]|uniref:alpha/beta fold hydrolase n=1 Tax=Oceaniradius stylonematis TaxID=2184161 RepID=UPI00273EAFAC|nr:alpha/beta hydrolase [Oceaniradius stylonematis]